MSKPRAAFLHAAIFVFTLAAWICLWYLMVDFYSESESDVPYEVQP